MNSKFLTMIATLSFCLLLIPCIEVNCSPLPQSGMETTDEQTGPIVDPPEEDCSYEDEDGSSEEGSFGEGDDAQRPSPDGQGGGSPIIVDKGTCPNCDIELQSEMVEKEIAEAGPEGEVPNFKGSGHEPMLTEALLTNPHFGDNLVHLFEAANKGPSKDGIVHQTSDKKQ